jgi:ribonuclease P protein component
MAVGAAGFGRQARLLRPGDFQRVGRAGRHHSSESFAIIVADRHADGSGAGARLGVTVSRKVGGAVARNRVKRQVREWFRRQRARLGEGKDVVVIARRPAASLRGREAAQELSRLLEHHLRNATPRRAGSPPGR